MMGRSHRLVLVAVALGLFALATLHAGEPFRYPEAQAGKGALKYQSGVPVLLLEGTPEQIGTQMASLTAKSSTRLLDYPRAYLKAHKAEQVWPLLVKTGNAMLPSFPADYRRELEAAVKASGLDHDLVVVGNTMFDIKKIAGCSTLSVEADHSATGGPLLGRNLDFPTLGYLQDYSLVTVCRPNGKHAFASIGFPGLLGCLSGMNDAGLALATLEVYSTKDGATSFDPEGTPYALCFRRLLEECTTIAEAEKLLRSMHRTTTMNLAICDRTGGAVLEITPKNVVVRREAGGYCPCTNHFRSKELATSTRCYRYDALEKCKGLPKLGLEELAKRLHAASQGENTLQTMIFEPATLKLHLAIGKCPTSALPMKTLELAPLLKSSQSGS